MAEQDTPKSISVEDAMVQSIGSARTIDYVPADKILEQAKAATPETKPVEKPVVVESQPVAQADSTKANSVADNKPKVDESKTTETPKTDETKPEETKAEETPDLEEFLGLKKPEESLDDVKKAYAESSREAHRLADERKALEQLLEGSLGLKLIRTKDGFDFDVTEKAIERASKELDDNSISQAWDKLPAEQRDLLDKEAFIKAAKGIALKEQAKRPVVEPKNVANVIANEDINVVCDQVAKEKLSNGSPRFPEFAEKQVQDVMSKLYSHPENSEFTQWMLQSQSNFRIGVKKLYAEAWRFIAPLKASKTIAESKKKDEQEKNKGPSITSDNSNVAPQHKAKDAVDNIVDRIGKANRG